MKVLITGGSSLLGRALLKTKPAEIEVEATWYSNYVQPMIHLDIANKSQVPYVFDRVKPEVVIHCAANGSVDYAESHYSECYEVNVLGTETIARACERVGAKLIFISTNAVFDGESPPYYEEREPTPINRYGSLKAQAEDVVRAIARHWVILRPFMLYGWPWPGGRGNWATLVINKLSQGQGLKIVNDTWWMPTYVDDVAEFIWQHALGFDNEVYHVAANQRMTLFDFAQKAAQVFSLPAHLIEPVGSDYFPNIAPRPVDSTFGLDKLKRRGVHFLSPTPGLWKMKLEQSRGDQ